MQTRIRRAARADLPRLVEIHTRAFPDGRGEEARLRRFDSNPLGGLEDAWIAEATDRTVVGHAFLFTLEAFFGGARVKIGAVASVGVAPEARGAGVATALAQHLAAESAARGDVLTVLYAFRARFYERLGYAPSSPYVELDIDPRSIPRAEGGRLRAATGADRAGIEAVYLRHARSTTGHVVRSESLWNTRFSDPRLGYVVATDGDRVLGYVAYRLVQAEEHAKVLLDVDELVAEDLLTRRVLLGHLRAQKDQVDAIRMDVRVDDPLLFGLVDPDGHRYGTGRTPHAFGTLGVGPMLRLRGPEALLARGYAADGAIAIALRDAARGEGAARTLGLSVVDGRASLVEPEGLPLIALDTRALAQIAFGGLPVEDAHALGLVEGAAPALADAARLLRLPPYFSPDPF